MEESLFNLQFWAKWYLFLVLKSGWEVLYEIYPHQKMTFHCGKTLNTKMLILINFLFPKKLGKNGTKMLETTCFHVLKFKIPF